METKCIEERAHNYAITNESNIQDWDGNYEIMVMSYEVGATDQDRIARQEEREKAIRIMRQLGVFDILAAEEGLSAACMEEQFKQSMEG